PGQVQSRLFTAEHGCGRGVPGACAGFASGAGPLAGGGGKGATEASRMTPFALQSRRRIILLAGNGNEGAGMDSRPRVCKFSGLRASSRVSVRDGMIPVSNRREFLRAAALTSAGLALSNRLNGVANKSVLVFTKSAGWGHEVGERVVGEPSLVDDVVTDLGSTHGFKVGVTKDGRIFESKDFHSYAAAVFFTTG